MDLIFMFSLQGPPHFGLILGDLPKGSLPPLLELLRSHCNAWQLCFFLGQR
jgi:hypothetical protein